MNSKDLLARDYKSNIQNLLQTKLELRNKLSPEEVNSILNPEITDEAQLSCVIKFRELLADKVMESHSNQDLLRFLKARNFNLDQTVSMYDEMLEIRSKFGLVEPDFLLSHTPLEAFMNHYPFGLLGKCKEGYPIVYDFPGRVDVKGFALAISDDEFAKQILWNLESLLLMMENKSLSEGKLVDKWTVIVDVRELSFDLFSKSQMTRNAKIQRLFDIGYPERVHKLIVVNLSPLFDIGYKLFRPFIPEATREKIVVTKNTGELLNYVDADQLPVVYGGTLVDSNGDPECKEWISLGSKVNPNLYKYNLIQSDTSMRHVQITPRNHHEIEIWADQNDVIKYKFCTDSKLVRFGVFILSSQGKKDKVWNVPRKSIGVEKQIVEGSVEVGRSDNFVFYFENKWLKTVNISVAIEVCQSNADDS